MHVEKDSNNTRSYHPTQLFRIFRLCMCEEKTSFYTEYHKFVNVRKEELELPCVKKAAKKL